MGFFNFINRRITSRALKKRTCESEEERMERVFYEDYRMPCCGSESFIKGPKGGNSRNIICAKCYTEFNIIPLYNIIEKIS